MAKRLLVWLMLLGFVGMTMGAGAAVAGNENTPSKQCPIAKRCPCGR